MLSSYRKIRLLIVFGVVVITTIIVMFLKSQQEFDRCDVYSGFHSYAWGGGSERCIENNCKVVKIKEIDNRSIYDDEGFEFKCVDN